MGSHRIRFVTRAASEILSQGALITAVSERLGHASPNITLAIHSHALPVDNEVAGKLWHDACE